MSILAELSDQIEKISHLRTREAAEPLDDIQRYDLAMKRGVNPTLATVCNAARPERISRHLLPFPPSFCRIVETFMH